MNDLSPSELAALRKWEGRPGCVIARTCDAIGDEDFSGIPPGLKSRCRLFDFQQTGGALVDTGRTVEVYNPSDEPLDAGLWISAKLIGGEYVVELAECPG